MFIRTIKMINERRDETIRQLLSISAAKRPLPGADTTPTVTGATSSGAPREFAGQFDGRHQGLKRRQASASLPRPVQDAGHNDNSGAGHDPLGESIGLPGSPSSLSSDAHIGASYSKGENINRNDHGQEVLERVPEWPHEVGGRRAAPVSRRSPPAAAMQDHNELAKEFNIKLESMIEFLADRQSALEADGKVCQLIESGVHAIVGPTDGASILHVQSICDNLEIPYFELRPFLGGTLSAPITSGAFVPAASVGAQSSEPAPLHWGRSNVSARGSPAAAPSETIHPSNSWPLAPETSASGEQTATTRRQQQKFSEAEQRPAAEGPSKRRPLDNDVDHSGDSGLLNGAKWPPVASGDGDNNNNNSDSDTDGNGDRDRQLEDEQPDEAPVILGNRSSFHLTANFEDIGAGGWPIAGSPASKQRASPSNGPDENNNNNNNGDYGARPTNGQPPSSLSPDQPTSASNGNSNNRNFANPSSSNKLEDLTLNLFPPSHMLTSAYIDMIYALNWTSFAIVYEDGSSMIKLQDLFKESSGTWASKWAIKLFRYDPNSFDLDETSAAAAAAAAKSSTRYQNNPNYNSNQNFHQRQQAASQRGLAGAQGQAHPSDRAPPPVASGLTLSNEESMLANNGDKQHLSEKDPFTNTNDEIKFATGQQRDRRHSTNDHDDSGDNSDETNDNIYQSDPPAHMADRPSKAPGPPGSSFRDVFWRVKLNGQVNILLDVKTENLYEALKQAQQVGCMTEDYSYLITSLDLHTIDLEDFKYSRTKITGFSLIQVAKSERALSREMSPSSQPTREDTTSNNKIDDNKLAKLQQTVEASGKPYFDEKYLENLGIVHLIQGDHHFNAGTKSNGPRNGRISSFGPGNGPSAARAGASNGKRTKATNINDLYTNSNNNNRSSWSKWSSEAVHNDLFKREMLQSSPASLGLLPTVDRNNEQRLFDFFLQQQELHLSRVRLSTSSAILHDSLLLYMLALYDLDPNGHLLARDQQAISCSLESQPWPHGSSMVNYMRQISFTGLTGPIQFDEQGLRANFKLDILGMAPNIRLVKVGEWHSRHAVDSKNKYFHLNQATNQYGATSQTGPSQQQQQRPSDGANYNVDSGQVAKSYDELSSGYDLELKRYTKMLASGLKVEVPYERRMSPNGALLVNDIIFERLYRDQADQIDTLIVTAKLSQPYFMLKETPNKLDGNDQFEGYAVDLIHELAKLVNFKYKWREVADKKYGSKETLPNGTVVWNGMIGEIVRGQADLAIVDLTITAQREEAVDFTLPFMNTGISILFKKPTTKVTTLFSFLSPFSSDVWAYVLAAYCGISAILFLVGHLSPYEWADPHPCRHLSEDDDETVLKNQFSLLNSFWFTIGSLMQQGSDLTPRSMSTRTIAGIWYFFTLIMISSYTANLAAFLTVEKVVYPIENVRDLSNQQEIKYGCVESGSTCLFFHDSQIDTYKRINETMRTFKTYVRSNDEGQKRVGEGKFAFFMESTTIEYIIERNCNLTQIGGLIDSKGYGLATSKKSRHKRPYRTLLNEGILHLQETGMLHVLKNRWWKERRGGGTCTDDGKGGGVTELSLANVGGVFVVLLGGLGISFLVAIAEFMWRSRRSGSSRDRMCEEMMNDLKFALACKSSTKPNTKANGRSSRRALRQQESFLSQYEDLDPVSLRAQLSSTQFNAKECDPILLHAMLTMLMQQQQQHQPNQNAGLTHSMSMPFASLDMPAKHELVSNMLQQQQLEVNSVIQRQQPHQKFGRNDTREFQHSATLNGIPTANQQQTSERDRARRRQLGWNKSTASSERRRTLHTQQTIDITDDNFPNIH